MSTTTSLMGLTTPSVGDTDYPTSFSNSFPLIDAHDHSTGKGTQILTAGIADAAVTQAKRAALGQQVSSSSGAFSTSVAGPTDITNLSVTITTTGRPVVLALIGNDAASDSELRLFNQSGLGLAKVKILRGVTQVCSYILAQADDVSTLNFLELPPSVVHTIDVPAAGTYTYKAQAVASTCTFFVTNVKLIAYEL